MTVASPYLSNITTEGFGLVPTLEGVARRDGESEPPQGCLRCHFGRGQVAGGRHCAVSGPPPGRQLLRRLDRRLRSATRAAANVSRLLKRSTSG